MGPLHASDWNHQLLQPGKGSGPFRDMAELRESRREDSGRFERLFGPFVMKADGIYRCRLVVSHCRLTQVKSGQKTGGRDALRLLT